MTLSFQTIHSNISKHNLDLCCKIEHALCGKERPGHYFPKTKIHCHFSLKGQLIRFSFFSVINTGHAIKHNQEQHFHYSGKFAINKTAKSEVCRRKWINFTSNNIKSLLIFRTSLKNIRHSLTNVCDTRSRSLVFLPCRRNSFS